MQQIDFTEIVVNGMLAFLLFAGSLHVDFETLRSRAVPVFLLAVFGTIISTGVVGVLFWGAAAVAGRPMPFGWALVFGALISPTDPVAVLSTLRNANVPKDLQVETEGEGLFNDGVGIVLFTVLLRFATSRGGSEISAADLAELLLREAGGGILLGIVTGYVAYRAMRLIDDYAVEVLVSVALVTGTYAMASHLHVSGAALDGGGGSSDRFRSVGAGGGWPATLGAMMDLALIFELLADEPAIRESAVLLRQEGLRLLHDINGLIGLAPRKDATSASDVMKLCGRLTAAGYKLSSPPDTAEFASRRREHAACIAAMAEHLGTPNAPLLP